MAALEGQDRQKETGATEVSVEPTPEQATESAHLKTRRRLIQVGLMSVPVLMTVRSRPAFAQSLGSAGIPYGAYLVDNQGQLILDAQGNLVPVKTNEDGMAVDINGKLILNHNDQEILEDPDRRVEGSINYKDYNKP